MMKNLLGGSPAAKGGQDKPPEGAGADETENLDEREGNVLLSMISQLRPGCDLSRITFPTFVLEPRSMLERITDFLSHPDLIFGAGQIDDPQERYIKVLQYYLAGWHIKPKGVKKPYNPILGEIFRCRYKYNDGSEGYYIAEQVSHHPPISAFYYCSPQNKLAIVGELKPKSKFLGNSVANEMGGYNHIILLDRPEDGEYDISMPDMYARGILFGKMVLELGGIVKVNNEANHIHCDVEFKTKGFFTGTYNTIQGKVKSSSGEIGEVSGKWSDQIYFARGRSHHSSDKELLFDAHKAVAVKQIIAPMSEQQDNESPKLWSKVTEAIKHNDQDAATEHKSAIEDRQRELAKMREDSEEHFKPKYFALKNGEYRPIFTLPKGSVDEQQKAVESWIFGSATASEQSVQAEANDTPASPPAVQEAKAATTGAPSQSSTGAATAATTAQPVTKSISRTSAPASKPVAIAGTSTPASQNSGPGSVPSSPETGVAGHLGNLFGRKHRKHAQTTSQVPDEQASSRQLRSPSVTR